MTLTDHWKPFSLPVPKGRLRTALWVLVVYRKVVTASLGLAGNMAQNPAEATTPASLFRYKLMKWRRTSPPNPLSASGRGRGRGPAGADQFGAGPDGSASRIAKYPSRKTMFTYGETMAYCSQTMSACSEAKSACGEIKFPYSEVKSP